MNNAQSTLLPFPKYAVFPRSEYYGSSAPTAPFDPRMIYPKGSWSLLVPR